MLKWYVKKHHFFKQISKTSTTTFTIYDAKYQDLLIWYPYSNENVLSANVFIDGLWYSLVQNVLYFNRSWLLMNMILSICREEWFFVVYHTAETRLGCSRIYGINNLIRVYYMDCGCFKSNVTINIPNDIFK